MAYEYVVYIDEAGDDGFGKLKSSEPTGQSRWFVVGACCLQAKNDAQVVAWRDSIAESFPNRQRRDIHFKFGGPTCVFRKLETKRQAPGPCATSLGCCGPLSPLGVIRRLPANPSVST
jgi:hypothetical protein